jgi:hypothetical protein
MAAKRTRAPKRRPTRRRTPTRKSREFDDRTDQPVRVRMYRLGLGECFLLTFARLGTPFHMLIDCGVALGPGADAKIRRVAKDILSTTGGRLDVLVVTHRHWDHISGFFFAQDTFKRMAVEQVWLGWTEDPLDAEARRLEQRPGFGGSARAQPLSEQAIDVVRRIGRSTRYWRGGEGPVALSGVPGTRVFFLAPPMLNGNRGVARRATAANARTTQSPFDQRYRVGFDKARTDQRFARYFAADWDWRRAAAVTDVREIAARSKAPIPELRLNRDEGVNNTSLVIAIELAGARVDRKVLLFPGDAQVPSWWSWHEHRWPPDDPNGVTCAMLLRNTVLYKVSHNGSMTGTAMQVGLDMMTRPDLVAMISVDREEARKKRWLMPAPGLLAALDSRTRGRIIRSDAGVPRTKGKDSDLSDAEWQEFQHSVHLTDLYIDLDVSIPQVTAGEREKLEANWTAANERRVYLVDKKLAGTIRPEEEAELREIDRLVDEYMSATGPSGIGLLAGLQESLEQTRRSGR